MDINLNNIREFKKMLESIPISMQMQLVESFSQFLSERQDNPDETIITSNDNGNEDTCKQNNNKSNEESIVMAEGTKTENNRQSTIETILKELERKSQTENNEQSFKLLNDLSGTDVFLEALQKERQRVIEKMDQPVDEKSGHQSDAQSFLNKFLQSKDATKEKTWYYYIFPEADVKELIAFSAPDYDNPHLLKLLKLTTGGFYYIVYLNSKNHLRCNEHGNIETSPHYDYEQDNETFVLIREAETCPTAIMTRRERHSFLVKLALAHQMRYEGCYKQVKPMVEDAKRFASHRNMAATRMWTLSTATLGAIIAVILLAMIHYVVPQWDDSSAIVQTLASDGLYAGLMGIIGGYTSLWLRYRSLGEVTFGGWKTVAMMAACRLLIGAVFAYVAILAVRSGLLFPSLEGHSAAIGVISFVAGFSERLIPSFIKNLSRQNDYDKEADGNQK